MRAHTIDGLYVEDRGPEDGAAIVFGHSLLCDRRMWEPQLADLARDHRCVALDFRGHGRSPAARRGFTMADQGEDYRLVMDALGVERAIVVGLSMGGMAAFHLAARHPQRVRGLALLNTSADRQIARPRFIALGALARLVGMRPFLRKQALAEMFGPTFRQARPDIVKEFDDRFAALDVPGATRALTMVVDRPSALDLLQAITAPTMIVAGEEDKATPPRLGRQILERMPHAEWHLLSCGHLSAVERPDEVTALLRAFVARVVAAGA